MYRIRFHGRGGQGIKTASRILGTAFFLEGFEVQDAPRYGAERRGAPIFAYVRADHRQINERGIIHSPDLVVVADETLLGIPAAGVLQGIAQNSVILIASNQPAEALIDRYPLPGQVVTLLPAHATQSHSTLAGVACAGGAARLTGVISEESLKEAIRQELSDHGQIAVTDNIAMATAGYAQLASDSGMVVADSAGNCPLKKPDWINLPFDEARLAAPAIHATLTSEKVKTGLWRSLRPVIDRHSCRRCGLCCQLCPEGAIHLDPQGWPEIDYEHCKGCLICQEQCPAKAIIAVAEGQTESRTGGGP